MKNVFKKFLSLSLCTLGLVGYINLSNTNLCSAAAKKEETENFNFIKAEEDGQSFLYDGSILLYGGILLICASVAGMGFTIFSCKRKKDKNKR